MASVIVARALGTVPVLERLIDFAPAGVPRKRHGDVVVRLARTSRALHARCAPHVAWARRGALLRHVLHRWRAIARRSWLRHVPNYQEAYRHATDAWFAEHQPVQPATMFVGVPLCDIRGASAGSTATRPPTPVIVDAQRVDGSCTVAADGDKTLRLTCRLRRCGDVGVVAHLRCNGEVCDARVIDAWYVKVTEVTLPARLIRQYTRWRDVQHMYLPLMAMAYTAIELVVRLRVDDNVDQTRKLRSGETKYTVDVDYFFHDGATRLRMLDGESRICWPITAEYNIVTRSGYVRCVERKQEFPPRWTFHA